MYGNYGIIFILKNLVLQKAFSAAKGDDYKIYLETIGPALDNLKNYIFGPKLYLKLRCSHPELLKYDTINRTNFNNNISYPNYNLNNLNFQNRNFFNNQFRQNFIKNSIRNNNNNQIFNYNNRGFNNNYQQN